MELLLFRPLDFAHLYNCSLIQIDSIPIEQRRSIFCGIIFVVLFFLYEALYLPCLLAIWKHIHNECYKMLLFMGIVDMLALFVVGLFTGIMAIEGAVFCSHPTLIYIAGCLMKTFYNTEIIMEIILSINRCMKTIIPKQSAFLFKGSRTWIWCLLTALFNVYWFLYIQASVFNAQYFNWFSNPYQGYLPSSTFDSMYPLTFHDTLHNMRGYLVMFGLPIIYAIFIVAYFTKMWRYRTLNSNNKNAGIETFGHHHASNSQQSSKAEKLMLLQVFIIGAINSITPLLYKIINFAPWASNEIMISAMFGLLHVHAAPPLIFLLFNKTIRADFKSRCQSLLYSPIVKYILKVTPTPTSSITTIELQQMQSTNLRIKSIFINSSTQVLPGNARIQQF